MRLTLVLPILLLGASLWALADSGTTYGPAPTTNQGQTVPLDVVIPQKTDPCAADKKQDDQTSHNPSDNNPRMFGDQSPKQQDSSDKKDTDKDCPNK